MIYKYLSEIKYRILFSIVAWVFTMFICYYFKEVLLYLVIKPSLNFTRDSSFFFLTTNIVEVFMTYLHLCYFISNQIIVFFLCHQFFIFISSGLYIIEYFYLKTFLLVNAVFWILAVLLFNNLIFPASWFFFLKFQNLSVFEGLTFYFETKLSEYVHFYTSTYFICCSIYQLTVLFFIFLNMFKTNLFIVKNVRKMFYFLFFFFSTLITPPEVVYQLIVSICIIIIYEFIVFYTILKTKLNNIKLVTN